MGILEIILIGVVLAMDAFAVSMCRGLSMRKIDYKQATVIALTFGVFQAIMPILGWLAGTQFEKFIERVDHWLAFGLLLLIGGKMIYDGLRKKKDEDATLLDNVLNFKELILMAIATSIDALAVGITFAIVDGLSIWWSVLIIGLITFALCFAGVIIGHKFGNRFEKQATLIGGIVLVLIGVKILLEHLDILHLGF